MWSWQGHAHPVLFWRYAQDQHLEIREEAFETPTFCDGGFQ
jgi:hypothetical protein